MSLANLEVVGVYDEKIDNPNKLVYKIEKGPLHNTYRSFKATSSNESATSFNCPPPSVSTYVDKVAYLKMRINVAAVGADAGVQLVPFNAVNGTSGAALRKFPLANMMNVLNVSINGNQITTNLAEYFSALSLYSMTYNESDRGLSSTPTYSDQYQTYAQGAGTTRNPLGSYSDNSYECPRGSFLPALTPVVVNNNTNYTASYDVVEPIFLSPLVWQSMNSGQAFTGINSMVITISWINNLSRAWCAAAAYGAGPTAGLTVTFDNTVSEIFFNYLSVQPNERIPRQNIYPYSNILTFPSSHTLIGTYGSVSPGQVSASLQLSSVPKKLYIFAREINNDRYTATGYLNADTFAGITNVSINWQNSNALLSSASQQELYQISVRNGLQMTWDQFSRRIGSVVCLEFGKDIELDILYAPGSSGQFQLQATVSLQNLNAARTAYSLYMVVVQEGVFEIKDQACSTMVAPVTPEDVLRAREDPQISRQSVEQDVVGGSFLSNIGPLIRRALPIIQTVGQVAGVVKDLTGEGLYKGDGLEKGSALMGGASLGGNMISAKQLKKRAQVMSGY